MGTSRQAISGIKPAQRLALSVLVLMLAFTLRVYALDRQDLWGDEAVSALVLKNNIGQILDGQVDPFHPPLYFVLLRLWTRLAGGTEFAIRYLSLMGALLGVAFVGRAAREMQGWQAALFALALAAAAPFLVYYAQEARMYGVAIAFNAGALWAACAALRQAGQPGQKGFWQAWIAFAALALGAMYAHYLSFLHLLGIAGGLLLAWRQRPRLLATAAGTALAMGLVYLPWALGQMNRTRGLFPSRPEALTLAELWRVAQDTLSAFSIGQILDADWKWVAVLAMTAAAALGCVWAARSGRPERWLHGIVVLTVIVAGWAFSARLFAFEPRYLMMGMPSFLLLAAAGLYWVGRKWPVIAGAVLIASLASAGLANYAYYTNYNKGGYGRLMHTVQTNAQTSDVLLLNNPLQRAILEYYRPEGVDYHYLSPDDIIDPARLDAALKQLTDGHKRAWLVMFGNPAEYDPQFRAENWLATHGAKSYYEGFGDSTLSLYVLSAPGTTITKPISVTFGSQIALTGYRLSAASVKPGDTLIVELDWQAIAPPDKNYTIFVQLIGPDGKLVAQVDTQPAGGTRPTSRWLAGETITDRYALAIPTTAAAGECQLITGLYPWPDLTRLPVTDAGGRKVANDAVQIDAVQIEVVTLYPQPSP